MRKTQKSKIKEKMDRFPPEPSLDESVGIIDMGFLWRMANPTADDREVVKRSGRNYTWGDYAKKVVSLLSSRHPKAVRIFCVNDVYNLSHTIKDDKKEH